MEQRSEEWFAERLGCITSTNGKLILNPKATQGGRDSLIGSLVREIATASSKHVPDGFWMRHGRETEPTAIAAYELYENVAVTPVGFNVSPNNHLLGDSPDGVVDLGEIGLECKCPEPDNHGTTLVTGKPYDSSYVWQIGWHMLVSGYRAVDYVSYCPDYPEHLKLFVRRYTMDDVFPEYTIKGKKFKTKEDIPDRVVTSAEQTVAAMTRLHNFLDDYQAALSRLKLTME